MGETSGALTAPHADLLRDRLIRIEAKLDHEAVGSPEKVKRHRPLTVTMELRQKLAEKLPVGDDPRHISARAFHTERHQFPHMVSLVQVIQVLAPAGRSTCNA